MVQNRRMTDFIPFNREQSYLLLPDLQRWLPEDDVAHFVIAAVERVGLSAFQVKARAGGKAQYHPCLMLALLIYACANGIFSSRRIERASYRDIGVRFVAANLHPDHDTIAAFRRANKAAFLQVLLLARESGLLRLALQCQGGGGRCRGRRSAGAAGRDRPARRAAGEACDAACARLEAEEGPCRAEYEAKKVAYDAKDGHRRSRPQVLPDDTPPAER